MASSFQLLEFVGAEYIYPKNHEEMISLLLLKK